jgi:hypothetical protein
LSASGTVEEPHDEQNRALGETCLPHAEQNMERRFYQRNWRKTTLQTKSLGDSATIPHAPLLYDARSTCTAVPYASTSVTPCITSVAS